MFLDFDGTLVEIAPTPGAVCVDEPLTRLIGALQARLDGRMFVVSGRPAAEVARLLSIDSGIVGSHGMEFLIDGALHSPQRPAALTQAERSMQALAAHFPGAMVEAKPLGVALHYRQHPAAAAEATSLAVALARDHGLHMQPGKMMVEVRAGGGDKGTAIHRLMQSPAMAGTRPIFLGDDHTDEPGFVTAARLDGAGILVGAPRETAATYRLDGVDAARAWLESIARAA